ncbi:IclR family transcriptional regulator [Acuticoccus sp. M5D2P5]|uniref:IclR family transcriptional regulator n=1 Tax=Acuticoccus kalidii TaxID=2910977 RepID=UPI001F27EACB|nr:IclR family transcriptional regulator [Acuticoccus kalidii]
MARGLDVLRAFRPRESSLTNNEIAMRTGLPKPTVSRLTYTLCRLGYLVLMESTGTYRLGPGVLELGYGVLAGIDINTRAMDEMRALCSGPSQHVSAGLAERHEFRAVLVSIQRSDNTLSLSMNVGSSLPLFHSAVGRAILVGMSDAERQETVDRANIARPGEAEAIERSVDMAFEDYERFGYCTSFGDFVPEMNAIAVPVLSLNGNRVYGLNVNAPAFVLSAAALKDAYGERLVEAGRALGPARDADRR